MALIKKLKNRNSYDSTIVNPHCSISLDIYRELMEQFPHLHLPILNGEEITPYSRRVFYKDMPKSFHSLCKIERDMSQKLKDILDQGILVAPTSMRNLLLDIENFDPHEFRVKVESHLSCARGFGILLYDYVSESLKVFYLVNAIDCLILGKEWNILLEDEDVLPNNDH